MVTKDRKWIGLSRHLDCCCSDANNSLWPHGLQHTRLLCLHYLPEFAQTHVYGIDNAIDTMDMKRRDMIKKAV